MVSIDAMAVSRTSVVLLCVCIGVMFLAHVSAVEEPAVKVEGAGATTQTYYLRGDAVTVEATTQGTPLDADSTEQGFDSFGTVDLQDYSPTANCRPKPCRP